MSKTILTALMAVFTVFAATAGETVKMVWPFGPVAATNPYRNIIEQANAKQNQHTFVLDFASGAGGTVAVNTVANSSAPALLAHSAAFFVNPKISESTPYNVNDWRVIRHICDIQYPLASLKFKNMKDLPKDKPITVGVVGLGSTTHLVQQWFAHQHPTMVAVPYKSATAALSDVMGGHLDMTVTLPGDVMGQYEAKTINVLGVTGNRPIKDIPTFVSQGYAGTEKLVGSYFIFANKKLDPALTESWKQLVNSVNQEDVNRISNQIYCTPAQTKASDLDSEFTKIDGFWAYVAAKNKQLTGK
jgi:tripartite-type tricarboxylate transporter receptor subunit TctC